MASNDSYVSELYLNALSEKSRNGDDTAFMEIIKEFPCLIIEAAHNSRIKM